MKLLPVVASVPGDVYDRLAPLAERIGASIEARATDTEAAALRRSGHTFTMLGWGHLLAAVAADGIELDLLTPDGVEPLKEAP